MSMEISIWTTISLLLIIPTSTSAATFTFLNKCPYTVWPGVLSNAGSPPLPTTGFELPSLSSHSFQAPTGWSGRFWGRTGCNFPTGGSCATGDCGSGRLQCAGSGALPPATLAEFTLGTGTLDFYDVSLVDGYNLPVLVSPTGGSGLCGSTGCLVDLNRVCPAELRVGGGDACRSACEAFGRPEYCCSGAYETPETCRPSVYSEMFKTACPRSYSYAYDDPTSTFTCMGADYTITFCPSGGGSSQKSTTPVTTPVTSTPPKPASPTPTPTPTTKPTPTPSVLVGSGLGSGSVSMSYDPPTLNGTVDFGMGSASIPQPSSTPVTTSTTAGGFADVADGTSYLARMAMGDSSKSTTLSAPHSSLFAAACLAIFLIICYMGL
ncbi:hypothetical protein Droror1_Dr00007091 [Drosera rotundifolia]